MVPPSHPSPLTLRAAQTAINRYRGSEFLLRALEDVPAQRTREEEKRALEADISAYYRVGEGIGGGGGRGALNPPGGHISSGAA